MSDNEIDNTQISKLIDLERYKNAEQLAKALKTYLPSQEEASKSRGRTKDKRICQLSAAYKYCIHLENTIKELCDKENRPVSDDCKLLHNLLNFNTSKTDLTQTSTNSSIMYKRLDQNNNEISDHSESHLYLTPNQQRSLILHGSSNLSASVCSNAAVKTTSSSNFNTVDASPIIHRETFYLYDTNIINNIGKNSISTETSTNSKKRKISNCSSNQDIEQESLTVDSNNDTNDKINKTLQNKENVLYTPNSLIYTSSPSTTSTSTSSSSSSSSSVSTSSSRRTSARNKSTAKTNENNNNIEVRRHYFLRSTNRLKDMLVANNIGSQKNTKLDSSITSSRLSSLTATPSIRTNSDVSSTSSLHELDTLDPKLSRVSLTDENMPQIY